MVLLSEIVVAAATLAIVSTSTFQTVKAWPQMRSILGMLGVTPTEGQNHAALFVHATLWSYASTRLLLETESPQSVVPLYLAIIFIFGAVIKNGKYKFGEFFLRLLTLYVVFGTLSFFISLHGLKPLSETAQRVKLDRVLEWYHPIFITISSLRWLFTFLAVGVTPWKGRLGWFLMFMKIAIIWTVTFGTGKKVFSSPWGALDEILLERNAHLYVILGLISFSIFMDQAAITVVAALENSGVSSDAQDYTWDDLKRGFSGRGFSSAESSSAESSSSQVGPNVSVSVEESDANQSVVEGSDHA